MNTNKRAADVIRALMVVTNTGGKLYSDKTKFGRSIKVTGWQDYVYQTAVRVLERHGYTAKISVKAHKRPRQDRMYVVTRLHVNNKPSSFTPDGL